MLTSQSPLPEAPNSLTDAELAVWARRQFPNAQGTLAILISRFHSTNENPPLQIALDLSANACPHCGTVVNLPLVP